MKSKLLLFLLFVTGLMLVARPQSTPPEEDLYKFRVIGWNRSHVDMFYLLDGEPQPVRLLQGTPSQLQSIPGPDTLTFYIPVETEEGIKPRPLARVILQPPPAQNLVVIWMNQKGKYQSAVLSDDPDNPGPGKLRLVNFSGNELQVQPNKEPIMPLDPGASRVITPQNEGVGLKVAVRKTPGDPWTLGLMTGITVRQGDRVTAFLADPSTVAPTLEEISSNAERNTEPLTLFVIRN